MPILCAYLFSGSTSSSGFSKDIDLILFPTTPIVAPKFANAEDLQKATHQISRNNVAIGYAGLPCLSVPVGFDSEGHACRHAACRQVVQ